MLVIDTRDSHKTVEAGGEDKRITADLQMLRDVMALGRHSKTSTRSTNSWQGTRTGGSQEAMIEAKIALLPSFSIHHVIAASIKGIRMQSYPVRSTGTPTTKSKPTV